MMEQMGIAPRKQRMPFVAWVSSGANRLYAWILTGILRSLGVQMRPRLVMAAVLFSTLFTSPAAAENAGLDLTELPIEILLEIEFAPVAGGSEGLLQFSGVCVITQEALFNWNATGASEVLLVLKVRVRSVVLQNGWCFYMPLFWDVNSTKINAGIAERSPDVSEGIAP